MNVNEMTKDQILEIPESKYGDDIGRFDSLIIIPTKEMHDSGYRVMHFVAVLENAPIAKICGGSDVVHINGIGGVGEDWGKRGYPTQAENVSWSIDCLKTSGFLRFFSNGFLKAGRPLSSFEIFHIKEK